VGGGGVTNDMTANGIYRREDKHMDQDAHYSLLSAQAELIAAWHTYLDRPMSVEQVKDLYRDKPHCLLMDANSASRWAAQRLASIEERLIVQLSASEARQGLLPHRANLN
jgi:hypothetical protein